MKVGDLVTVYSGIGIIMAYYKQYDGYENEYPWYVWINGGIRFYRSRDMELV
jgi:hypothetical protein